jgi:hypothetical protein
MFAISAYEDVIDFRVYSSVYFTVWRRKSRAFRCEGEMQWKHCNP